MAKPIKFVKEVANHIRNEAVSFVALLVSLGAMAYDKLVQPVTIPTGKLALTSAGAPSIGVSLFAAGLIVAGIVITVAVVRTAAK